jgi:hypothetical protein
MMAVMYIPLTCSYITTSSINPDAVLKPVPDDNATYLAHLEVRFLESYRQFFREIRKGKRARDLLLLRLQIDNILTEIELTAHENLPGTPAATSE